MDEAAIREEFERRMLTLMRNAPPGYVQAALERRPDGRYVQMTIQRNYRHFRIGFEMGYIARAKDDALKGMKKAKR
ncbi:hypothetical protein CcrKarma_gp036 [Caulobacter virus Karma]|uniref:Uncharacterized protein n=1 Tax=Caulobacter phage CcrSwift TaxID=2927984 RepID=K4JVH3_9CAUD|nr:hypothetical protein CcrKarma_gp036 [Caulobacter virus Karma]YP_006989765.1 hypothetical protein D870_gp032 [Caulobacter phage CcrSwift]AFU87553.1 hypothetical protein CcrKarma_gp036 [Caulobacter virus Karma]AFU88350.1 hypothetical protein CcrSwift_gp032 [Caulobacter phage CcrSwift]